MQIINGEVPKTIQVSQSKTALRNLANIGLDDFCLPLFFCKYNVFSSWCSKRNIVGPDQLTAREQTQYVWNILFTEPFIVRLNRKNRKTEYIENS